MLCKCESVRACAAHLGPVQSISRKVAGYRSVFSTPAELVMVPPGVFTGDKCLLCLDVCVYCFADISIYFSWQTRIQSDLCVSGFKPTTCVASAQFALQEFRTWIKSRSEENEGMITLSLM